MKTIRLFSIIFFCFAFAISSNAQKNKSETIKVAGNCGMCKNAIEKAAISAGATFAEWDKDKKVLTVKYSVKSTDNAAIQKKVAEAGYDTEDIKAKDEDYDKLPDCCKYDRKAKKDSQKINDN